MRIYGNFLHAGPSFAEGLARIFDFGNTLGEYDVLALISGEDADADAIRMDWTCVGDDIRNSLAAFELEDADDATLAG